MFGRKTQFNRSIFISNRSCELAYFSSASIDRHFFLRLCILSISRQRFKFTNFPFLCVSVKLSKCQLNYLRSNIQITLYQIGSGSKCPLCRMYELYENIWPEQSYEEECKALSSLTSERSFAVDGSIGL